MKQTTIDRARAYLARIPGAVSGSGGHNDTFHAACVLVNGFALSVAEALPLLLEWNSTCQPPWSEADLRHKLTDADKTHHAKPRGHLLADAHRATHFLPARTTPAPEPEPRPLPDRTGFVPGTPEELRRLATMRPFDLAGLRWAQARGALVFGHWHGFDCFGVTDASGRVLELRRLDGESFPAVPGTSLGERKSHAVKGSQKAWPVGIMEARDFAAIALVEGLPDFLDAHHLALFEQASHYAKQDVGCAPVAMLSASPQIHPDALPHFAGKTVRIFSHAERAGLLGAEQWQRQLEAAGAAKVDVFDFSPYRTRDGQPVNDLYDWRDVHPDHYAANPELWRALP